MQRKGLIKALLATALLAPFAWAGPVDVNTADAKTLAKELDGIGMAKAQAIVEHRKANGPFKSAEELARVKGIGSKTVELNRANLRFDSGKPAARGGGD